MFVRLDHRELVCDVADDEGRSLERPRMGDLPCNRRELPDGAWVR